MAILNNIGNLTKNLHHYVLLSTKINVVYYSLRTVCSLEGAAKPFYEPFPRPPHAGTFSKPAHPDCSVILAILADLIGYKANSPDADRIETEILTLSYDLDIL